MNTQSPPSHAERDHVRRHVRATLEAAPSYRAQPPEERKKIAHNMVRVMSFLSDPYAGHGELKQIAQSLSAPPVPPLPANALASGLASKRQEEEDPDHPKPKFGPASQSVAGVMGATTDAVGFVDFVSGLIEGVFTSIVNTTIRQMQEFAKFLEAVVKSTKEFMDDHVSEDEAKTNLAQRFPNAISQGDDGKLKMNSGLDDDEMPDFQSLLGLKDKPEPDDETSMQKLVDASRLQMARQRQQQLSAMLLMGINRIVVTEGEIKASVLIDVTGHDKGTHDSEFQRDNTDTRTAASQDSSHKGGMWDSGSSNASSQETKINVSTAHARIENKSENTLDAHAKLAGSVLVRFKSETFPLEKLASTAEVAAVQQNSTK